MNRLSLKLLCQIFLLLALLAATIASALPHSLPALVLLLIILFITLRPRPPRINAAVTTSALSMGSAVGSYSA